MLGIRGRAMKAIGGRVEQSFGMSEADSARWIERWAAALYVLGSE